MKRHPQRFTTSCLALAMFGAFSCQSADRPDDASEQRRAFTGEEVFAGIFFGIGPVADLLPELFEVGTELSPEATLDMQSARRTLPDDRARVELEAGSLFSWIHASDPTFFERFGEAMQSGDHVEIDEMLDESITVLGEIRDAHPDAFGGLTDVGRGTGLAWNDAVIFYQYYFYMPHYFWWGGGSDKESNPLARERTVDVLAERLAAESFD